MVTACPRRIWPGRPPSPSSSASGQLPAVPPAPPLRRPAPRPRRCRQRPRRARRLPARPAPPRPRFPWRATHRGTSRTTWRSSGTPTPPAATPSPTPRAGRRPETARTVHFTDKLNGVSRRQPHAIRRRRPGDSARAQDGAPAERGRGRLRAAPAHAVDAARRQRRPHRLPPQLRPRPGDRPQIYRDEVQEYDVYRRATWSGWSSSGPVGADNVDAYRTMSQSLPSDDR